MNDNGLAQTQPTLMIGGENVLARLITARAQASKEANRLFLASLALTGLYIIKASGLRIDLALFNKQLAQVPYGLFFFLVGGQLAAALCYMRAADASAINGRIERHVRAFETSSGARGTDLVNEFEWFSASSRMFEEANPPLFAKIVYRLVAVPSGLTVLILYLGPIIAGVYALHDWQVQLNSGNIDLQYWTLFSTTVLSGVWFVNYCVIQSVTAGQKGGE